ncbi:RrF2 family transcriptional regulator [Methylophilus aquaticus]|uniref:Rrf2 family transcriptional regulator n=1 Tax=Methylophilus aquaticus TaxID=1971610 RepID=A0ABT9JPK1_9PROT|nr:Rrf2 family transcriptional regulator [Methylophilus aquaticus]MDP8566498.1 Rrf2 family transcriptional regulator [Methylophilus aquaticus]
MQITKFTDLSLRVLMYLTYEANGAIVTINEIAQQFDVPRNHLIKVVTRLNKLNWVITTRGRNGGLKLAMQASELKLGNILMELENKTSLINCAEPPCVLAGRCNLKNILDHGLHAFYHEMNQYSLKAIMDKTTQNAVIQLHQRYATAL